MNELDKTSLEILKDFMTEIRDFDFDAETKQVEDIGSKYAFAYGMLHSKAERALQLLSLKGE